MISDGAGGAFLCWAMGSQLQLQRISISGVLQWTEPTTVAIDYATPSCIELECSANLVTDGAGGAIAVWRTSGRDVYAQRVLSDGSMAWGQTPLPVCTAPDNQVSVVAAADGYGGVIVAWTDVRNLNPDVFAQRLGANGSPLWPLDGIGIATGVGDQDLPSLAADGFGGAIVSWNDYAVNDESHAQRVDGSGQIMWDEPRGVYIGGLSIRLMMPDGEGGALIGLAPTGALAGVMRFQRITSDGLQPWGEFPDVQTEVCNISGFIHTVQMCSDGSGGAVVTWADDRNGELDIFAQRMSGLGTRLWGEDGIAVSTTTNVQECPFAVPSLGGSTILAWDGVRVGTGSNIYAQQVSADGVLGDVPSAAEVDLPESLAMSVCNPCSGMLTLSYVLPAAAHASVSVVDVAGRIHAGAPPSWQRAGQHQESFDTKMWRSGVYIVQLESGGVHRSMKTIVVH